MALEVLAARSARDLRRFVDVPWHVYDRARHPQWVPPLRLTVRDALDDRRHPFYRTAERECFVALRDGRPVARVAAIANRAHNEYHKDSVGFFGFFEAREDDEAAAAVFDHAQRWLAARGLTAMRGPMNPSTNYECGLLVDGFQWHPYLMTTWNPEYYPAMLERLGFAGVKDLLGFSLPVDDTGWKLPERYAQHAARAAGEQNVVFRSISLSDFENEIARCWDIYNAAWEDNWGFVPMSRDEFWHMARDMKQLLEPAITAIAEVDGEPVGFALALPDYNEIFRRIPSGRLLPTGIFRLLLGKSKIRTGRILALGVKSRYRARGVFQLLAQELYRRGRVWGGRGGEASWILADNAAMVRPLQKIGATPYRRWRIYERPTGEAA